MTSRRNFILGFGATTAGAFALGQHRVTTSRSGTAFGTTVNLEATASTAAQADAALDAGYAEIRAVHKVASLFDPASEVSQLNSFRRLERPTTMLHKIIQLSQQLHDATGGAFDPTVQPLWRAWSGHRPSQQEVSEAVARVGWEKLLKRGDQLALVAGSSLTFNGIAQGYAADRVVAAMQREGAISARVDTGEAGRLHADGALAIQHPRKPEALGFINVRTGFVAVSGDYASTFTVDFLHHHIFDPKLGVSPHELSSVVVVAPTGAYADGLATAFMVMGVAASLDCLHRLDGCSALFVDKAGTLTLSHDMQDVFQST